MKELKEIILAAWENRDLLKEDKTIAAIRELIELIDKGQLRCAEPTATGWQVNDWVKKRRNSLLPYSANENHRSRSF